MTDKKKILLNMAEEIASHTFSEQLLLIEKVEAITKLVFDKSDDLIQRYTNFDKVVGEKLKSEITSHVEFEFNKNFDVADRKIKELIKLMDELNNKLSLSHREIDRLNSELVNKKSKGLFSLFRKQL